MLKKFGLPIIALLALMIFITPAPAQAGVRFGVQIGPAYPYGYAYPYAYGNPYYYNGYPAYPYVAPGYAYPYGYSTGYWGGGRGYYRGPVYRGGAGGWHGQSYHGGGGRGGYRGR